MTHPDTIGTPMDPRRGLLCKIGGAAALITGILVLVGLISLIASILQPGTAIGWLVPFQNNWLLKIFVLHAGFDGIQADLYGLNLLDLVILLLVSILCLSLSTAFKNTGKGWSLAAFVISLLAIILFVVTQIAGRSAVMLVVLINSLVMPRDKIPGKAILLTGIPASLFLFTGDLTVGVHSNIITALFGVGYVLLVIWFFLAAQALFRSVGEWGMGSRIGGSEEVG